VPDLEAIIPSRALQELARIATGENVEVGVHENQVVFGTGAPGEGGIWLTTRRIDGQFPNYRQLLPEQFEYELALPREELLEVVRRVSLMAQRNSPLRLRFADGDLTRRSARSSARRLAGRSASRPAARWLTRPTWLPSSASWAAHPEGSSRSRTGVRTASRAWSRRRRNLLTVPRFRRCST